MASGLLSLKWNHHRSTFLHVLANIRQKESYCDVTLACAGKFYSAHKLVLSTCSEYFEEMFERTQCKHPVIVLKDIGADELEALLSYMYDGEVNVLQENLSSLIKAAECLKIKGLAVADSDPSEHSSKSTKDKSSSSSSNSNGKDVHRSHNSNSTSNSNNHNFQSDSSSRQFRNSSGGVKRPSLSSKQDDGPSKRRRPEPSSLSSAAASPARRQSTERPGSAPRGGGADGKDGDDGGSDGAEGGEDGGNSMEGAPSAADDQPHEEGGSDDARSFAQGLSEQTGVKAEPVEIIDSDDMGGFDPQTGDGGSHDASDAEFTEEKFPGGGADANDPSLWGGGANNDMFSQPSTSSFTGQDGSNSNDNNSGGGKGGGGGGSSILGILATPPTTTATPTSISETTTADADANAASNITATVMDDVETASFHNGDVIAGGGDSCNVDDASGDGDLALLSATSLAEMLQRQLMGQDLAGGLHNQDEEEQDDKSRLLTNTTPLNYSFENSASDLFFDCSKFLEKTEFQSENLLTSPPLPNVGRPGTAPPISYNVDYRTLSGKLQSSVSESALSVGFNSPPGGSTNMTRGVSEGMGMGFASPSNTSFGGLSLQQVSPLHHHQYQQQQQYQLQQHQPPALPCPFCPYKTPWKHNLKTHIRRHTGEKPYRCQFCGKPFTCKTGLNMHVKIHTGQNMFGCSLCPYQTTQRQSLRFHVIKHHPGTDMP